MSAVSAHVADLRRQWERTVRVIVVVGDKTGRFP
jgi:hypothetical protein